MGTDFGGTGTRKSLVLTHPSKEHWSLLFSGGGGESPGNECKPCVNRQVRTVKCVRVCLCLSLVVLSSLSSGFLIKECRQTQHNTMFVNNFDKIYGYRTYMFPMELVSRTTSTVSSSGTCFNCLVSSGASSDPVLNTTR